MRKYAQISFYEYIHKYTQQFANINEVFVFVGTLTLNLRGCKFCTFKPSWSQGLFPSDGENQRFPTICQRQRIPIYRSDEQT